jgi:hypothetical protein
MVRIYNSQSKTPEGGELTARQKVVTPTPNNPRRQRRQRFRNREVITYYATHPPLVVAHVGCAQALSSGLRCGVLNSVPTQLFDIFFWPLLRDRGHDVTV